MSAVPSASAFAATLLQDNSIGIGPVLPEDTANMFLWINDIETAAQDLAYRPVDGVAFNAWLSSFANDASRVIFVIRKIPCRTAIGFVTINNIQAVHRCGELGIRIGRDGDRGRGFGKRAVSLACDFAWTHLNLNRLQLRVLADNVRAISAYKAVGFFEEGLHREAAYIGGRWADIAAMAILRPAQESRNALSPPRTGVTLRAI